MRGNAQPRLWAITVAAAAALLGLSGSAVAAGTRDPAAAPARNVAPQLLSLSGDLQVHDPALTRDGPRGDWYVFSTGDLAVAGGTVQIRRSPDLHHWTYAGTVFSQIPAWVAAAVPGVENIWAPDVHEHDGVFYLYYAASTFGSNRSVIGLATNTTLDPGDPAYHWTDRGLVTQSQTTDDYNAIDPGVIEDARDGSYLAFGSFWSGIRMLKIQWPSGRPVPGQGEPLRLADRLVPPNAIEAPYVIHRGGWYYLFVSIDFCCRGTGSTYKIAVGRSRLPTGPYLDELGTPMVHGGGTVILSERGSMIGPGGQSVYGAYLAHHFYDATQDGEPRLSIRRIGWTADGWPRLAPGAPAPPAAAAAPVAQP